jgi:hypothetical protein
MKRTTTLILSIVSILGGMLFFSVTHNIIIIRFPSPTQSESTHKPLHKTLMRFTYWKGTTRSYEWRPIIQDDEDIVNAQRIITTYWTIIEDNGLLSSRIHVESTATDRTGKVLLCSLSNNPCSIETSTLDAWLIIEGLILTLRELMPQFQKILFLVNHEPLIHPNLDYSRPWPLEGFSTHAQFSDNYTKPSHGVVKTALDHQLILYINPSGTAYHPGRTIGNLFERGIAIHCAQALRDELAVRMPLTRVVINQAREETRDALQHINQANKIRANMYIHLSFYQTQNNTPDLTIFTFRWHPTTDLWKREIKWDTFVPFHEAHMATAALSNNIAQHMFYYAATTRPYPLCAAALLALPYKPLTGIAIPAVAIEIGINNIKQLADITPAITDLVMKGLELIQCTPINLIDKKEQ